MASLTSQVGAGGGGSVLLGTVTSAVDVHSTTTETTLMSFTLTGGDLGTDNMVRVALFLSDFDGSAGYVTFRLKYGATTVASFNFENGATALTNTTGEFHAALIAAGATNSQAGSISMQVCSDNNFQEATNMHNSGTGAEDSTGDLTFSITAQPEVSGTTCGVTVASGYAELVPMAA